ncbi:MAG TPA: hypothetical protein VHZ51_13960 [Ktedonobacteraceae bacterium]|jgi:hypothetical protein|nr:hypothetical protein [Ktedonobacteraceae bacterium]
MLIATDPLSLVFIGCFLFGLLFLVVSALLGQVGHGLSHSSGHIHVGHVGHVGTASATLHQGGGAQAVHGHGGAHITGGGHTFYSYVNPMSVALFLLGFGFCGYLFHNVSPFALPFVLLCAVVSGFIIASVLLSLLNRMLSDSEASTVQDIVDRTGVLGKVSLTIPENGLGEILYVSPGGMRKSIPARTADGNKLERDQEVVVVNYQNGVAEVDTWDHFIDTQESGESEDFHQAAPENDQSFLRSLLEEPPQK